MFFKACWFWFYGHNIFSNLTEDLIRIFLKRVSGLERSIFFKVNLFILIFYVLRIQYRSEEASLGQTYPGEALAGIQREGAGRKTQRGRSQDGQAWGRDPRSSRSSCASERAGERPGAGAATPLHPDKSPARGAAPPVPQSAGGAPGLRTRPAGAWRARTPMQVRLTPHGRL